MQRAFLELLQVKQFDQIAIKEITEHAGVSYPVFFRQFRDKEELLADVATEQVRNLFGHMVAAFDANSEMSVDSLCGYVRDHRKLWRTLLTGGANAAMRAEFSRVSRELMQTRPRYNPGLPLDLSGELVANAIFDILTWWMRQPDDYPVGNVIRLLDTLVVRIYTRPLDLRLE